MRIIPVVDLKGGQVVRGLAGRRHEYRPIVSRLTSSSSPVEVGRAFRDQLGLTQVYLADLDAIAGAEPAWATYHALQALGLRLWIDPGIRDHELAERLAAEGIDTVVVGLETVAGPDVLARICQTLGSQRVVFSLDLNEELPLGDTSRWARADVPSLAAEAVAAGVKRVLILDLARVGVGSGTGTEKLCSDLAKAFPPLEIAAGGGVRGAEDLHRLKQCGVHAVLVASALHDGRLEPNDWAAL
jgi:phosphoribosylformimino-5-aminoimidazole carboxamide ribotide isomerase